MKWYHWVAIAIGLVAVRMLFKITGASSTSNGPAVVNGVAGQYVDGTFVPVTQRGLPPGARPTGSTGVAGQETNLVGAWGGVDASRNDLKPAYTGSGWNPYPGWFRTGDGGWYNPDTGESYSPGSSPVALSEPKFINIDLTQGGLGVNPTPGDSYNIA